VLRDRRLGVSDDRSSRSQLHDDQNVRGGIEARIRRVVSESLGTTLDALGPLVSLRQDLAVDSLDVVELALVLEREFAIGFPDAILHVIRSYGDLVEATVRRVLAFDATGDTPPPAIDGDGARETHGPVVLPVRRSAPREGFRVTTAVTPASPSGTSKEGKHDGQRMVRTLPALPERALVPRGGEREHDVAEVSAF
jgi:acyl carrier protein